VILIAEGSGGESIPGLQYLSQTVLGIIVLLALFGWVWFKPAVEELKERAARAERQRDDLLKTYEAEIIPVLREVQGQMLPLLGSISQTLRDLDRDRR
jgi:uncharacterized membrane protein